VSRPPLPGLVRKEARALWPIWAGCAAVCVAAAATGLPTFVMPGQLAYFVGSVTLAAMSVGHEYTAGTLAAQLSLPVERRRLIAAKLLALLPMLGSLGLLALAIGAGGPYFERGTIIGALSVVAAAALAPWLTMVCRSPLAGAVFALGIAGVMQLASLGAVLAWYRLAGTAAVNMQTLHDRVLAISLAAISVIAATAGWRTFIRLEATGGRDTHFAWPRWLRSAMTLDEAEVGVAGQ